MSIKKLPRISVVIPSYNKVDYIKDTLQSLVNQKYPNLEVIIQDGGSSDGSMEIIKEFAKKYPNIFKWVSKKDGGQVEAINEGLIKAKGDIVTYLNADDIYSKNALLIVGNYFLENPETLWVTGYCNIINKENRQITSFVTWYKNLLLNLNKYTFLLMVNFISQPAVFLNNTAYKKYGPFVGTKRFVLEYDLWLKLGRIQMPKIIKQNLASFRLALDNISSTSSKELLLNDQEIVKRYTKNKIVLLIHSLHNLLRIGLISLLKI